MPDNIQDNNNSYIQTNCNGIESGVQSKENTFIKTNINNTTNTLKNKFKFYNIIR